MMMISAAGGMDIEEVAATNPEKIINVHLITSKMLLDSIFNQNLRSAKVNLMS